MADLVRLSKFLALALRHRAEDFNLTLDEEGFVETDTLWALVNKRFPGQYTHTDLLKVVDGDQDGKKRYEIRGRYIRALYGHSHIRQITYPAAEPPEFLYHGTTKEALPAIRKQGLKSLGRQYVHMAINTHRAQKVAQRHQGSPILLKIRALDAFHAGVVFYHPEAEHFLAENIPAEFIEFPE